MQYNIEDLERQVRGAAEGETTMTAQLEAIRGQLEAKSAELDTTSAAYDAKAVELQASQVRTFPWALRDCAKSCKLNLTIDCTFGCSTVNADTL